MLSSRLAVAGALCLVLSTTGCSYWGFRHRNTSQTSKAEASDENMVVNEDDHEVNGAVQTAQWQLQTFIDAIQKPHHGDKIFMVKKRFYADDGTSEDYWISNVDYDSTLKEFHGMVANDPANVRTIKYGDKVNVVPTEVTDWLIIQDDKLTGGYTMRVAYRRASPAEKARMRQETGLADDQLSAPF
jgi:uncharacterized protein YegJ (DUF2314 family)